MITADLLLKFLKEYGFLLESDEIYGGLFSIYDSGPATVKTKKEIKALWWNYFVNQNIYIHGYESNILTHPQTLRASGHIDKFINQVMVCQKCQKQFRDDFLLNKQNANYINCPYCLQKNKFKKLNYNLLFETWQGCEEEKKRKIYLRPETAQGIFTNFKKIKNLWKLNLPFGLAQIGKAFRNELTTKYANFKSCEFELMEIEFFYAEKKESDDWFEYWKKEIWTFLLEVLQIKKENIQAKVIESENLAHYSEKTLDFEYKFPFGWREIWGLSVRGNFDLTQHQTKSKNNLTVTHQDKQIIPYVIEPSVGVERLFLAMISDNLKYKEKKFTLQIPFAFCYYQIAILPLVEKLTPLAQEVQTILQKQFSTKLDSKKTIGKRYLFHDAIGTFFCITIDFESLNDQKITIRWRDAKQQTRVAIKDLNQHITNAITRK